MARMKSEDVSWIDEANLGLEQYIYVVDDPEPLLRPPENKGHEAMVYLTYIIDYYDSLPDISLFMHALRNAYHNDLLFDTDAVGMIRHLSNDRVMREGYVNLRCRHNPGCPNPLNDDLGLVGENVA